MVGQGAVLHPVVRPIIRVDGGADHGPRSANLPHGTLGRDETVRRGPVTLHPSGEKTRFP